jgi:hypothetical protein
LILYCMFPPSLFFLLSVALGFTAVENFYGSNSATTASGVVAEV